MTQPLTDAMIEYLQDLELERWEQSPSMTPEFYPDDSFVSINEND